MQRRRMAVIIGTPNNMHRYTSPSRWLFGGSKMKGLSDHRSQWPTATIIITRAVVHPVRCLGQKFLSVMKTKEKWTASHAPQHSGERSATKPWLFADKTILIDCWDHAPAYKGIVFFSFPFCIPAQGPGTKGFLRML